MRFFCAALLAVVAVGALVASAATLHETAEDFSLIEVRAREAVMNRLNHRRTSASTQSRAHVASRARGLDRGVLERTFVRIDADHSGSLSIVEVREFFTKDVKNLFAEMDEDRSGSVSHKEFMDTFLNAKRQSGEQQEQQQQEQQEQQQDERRLNDEDDDEHAELSLADVTIDYHTELNTGAHHTERFVEHNHDNHLLIARRGQAVTLTVHLPEGMSGAGREFEFRVGKEDARFLGDKPFRSMTFGVKRSKKQPDAGSVRLRLFLAADAPVGSHELQISTPGSESRTLGTIVVMFNPWSKFDEVYMADEAERDEYVLADQGRLWYGDVLKKGEKGASSMAWGFHQFELLEAALLMLEEVAEEDRSSAVMVSRTLTHASNAANNQRGLAVGRWDADFSDGVKPTSWTGSRKIFRQWMEEERTPVRYAQCWVFAGVLTTALRALGVPSRPVTGYRAAHDFSPFDGVIDKSEGESVWNFHVWTEAYMRRRDLKKPAEWNVLDATPQEESDGRYQLGPAALSDVRAQKSEGTSYDTAFVISEVDAHLWIGDGKYDADAELDMSDVDTDDIGQFISTKKVGCMKKKNRCREDLTSSYKPEGSSSRFRASMKNQRKHFVSTVTPDRPRMGGSFGVQVRRNELELKATTEVLVTIRVSMTTYAGDEMGLIKEYTNACVLAPDPADAADTCRENDGGWHLEVAPSSYVDYLRHDASIRVFVSVETPAQSDEAGRIKYYFERQFTLTSPSVQVRTVPPRIVSGEPFQAVVSFRNPLPVELTALKVYLDTPDYDKVAVFSETVRANAHVELVTNDIIARSSARNRVLAVSVDTEELVDLYGSATVDIHSPDEVDRVEDREAVETPEEDEEDAREDEKQEAELGFAPTRPEEAAKKAAEEADQSEGQKEQGEEQTEQTEQKAPAKSSEGLGEGQKIVGVGEDGLEEAPAAKEEKSVKKVSEGQKNQGVLSPTDGVHEAAVVERPESPTDGVVEAEDVTTGGSAITSDDHKMEADTTQDH